jgi:hypothetical protein
MGAAVSNGSSHLSNDIHILYIPAGRELLLLLLAGAMAAAILCSGLVSVFDFHMRHTGSREPTRGVGFNGRKVALSAETRASVLTMFANIPNSQREEERRRDPRSQALKKPNGGEGPGFIIYLWAGTRV